MKSGTVQVSSSPFKTQTGPIQNLFKIQREKKSGTVQISSSPFKTQTGPIQDPYKIQKIVLEEHMAWLSGPNPFFQESKNYKNLTLKRKKFTKTKAKKICPRSQDSCQFSPNLLSRHDATVPERSWSPVASYQLPVAKLQGDDPLGFVLLLSVSRNQAKEREPFSAEYPKKEPLQEPRKKEKICWKCSRTFSFNDKMVLFAS